MIHYKITTLFQADWKNVFEALFPDRQHSYSSITENTAVFGFEDETVVPADLGPLVKVERVDSIPFHSP